LYCEKKIIVHCNAAACGILQFPRHERERKSDIAGCLMAIDVLKALAIVAHNHHEAFLLLKTILLVHIPYKRD